MVHQMLQSVQSVPLSHQPGTGIENDCRLKVQFCKRARQFCERSVQNPDFFWNVCFGDETTFHSNGSLNKHNNHYWSLLNLH